MKSEPETAFIPDELEKRLDVLTEKLVPDYGPGETLEGEMVRAINRILYRFYNDGDLWYQGYGCETAGPAAAFLMSPAVCQRVDLLADMAASDHASSPAYEKALFKVAEKILDYIEARTSYEENSFDMLNFPSRYQPEYDDEDEDEDYDDEE